VRGAGMWEEERKWIPIYATLLGFFVVVLVLSLVAFGVVP